MRLWRQDRESGDQEIRLWASGNQGNQVGRNPRCAGTMLRPERSPAGRDASKDGRRMTEDGREATDEGGQ